ncbi:MULTISPECIES: hypothetical protein [unclassified Francisella]|uniref:hypothetical protein n=1 Tax=unclassified Francisella TaxID=2610885 RepID=UPI002E360B7B|nr:MULTISPECIES: hypothetical protein [unclassified Francisella]MED7820184.1 hypothetical protein [Francisella sp. 19S2-4]MED7831004.1 hypothetical protein [Francisella sp. 19S2-10]
MKLLLFIALVFIIPFSYATTRGCSQRDNSINGVSFLDEQQISPICAKRKIMEDRIAIAGKSNYK